MGLGCEPIEAGKPVVIRLFDLDAHKAVGALGARWMSEKHSARGGRILRLSCTVRALFVSRMAWC